MRALRMPLWVLRAIRSSRNQGQQAMVQTISQKQQQLERLLDRDSPDSGEIGQLSIELHQLRKQRTAPFEPYHSQALAILTTEQQAPNWQRSRKRCSSAVRPRRRSPLALSHRRSRFGPFDMNRCAK
jgi:hypothetical protein